VADQEGTRRAEEETPIDDSPPPFAALIPDPLVETLVPDPGTQPPPPTVALAGLLGKSAKEGRWRLYFSPSLERYAEFKEEDVLGSVKIPQEQPPFAGLKATRVWLKREAEVEYTRTEARRVRAEVLDATWDRVVALGIIEEGTVHPFFRSNALMLAPDNPFD
jgi:hypothetical protein